MRNRKKLIQIDEAIHARLKNLSEETGVTITSITERVLANYLDNYSDELVENIQKTLPMAG